MEHSKGEMLMGIYDKYDWKDLNTNLGSDSITCKKCGFRKKKVIRYESKGTGCCILSKTTTICRECGNIETCYGTCGTT